MRRTRIQIEADLNAAQRRVSQLKKEWGNVQPDKALVTSQYGRQVSLHRDDDGKTCVVTMIFDDVDRRRTPNAYLAAESAGELRDWLNYHFPKENA